MLKIFKQAGIFYKITLLWFIMCTLLFSPIGILHFYYSVVAQPYSLIMIFCGVTAPFMAWATWWKINFIFDGRVMEEVKSN